MKRIIILFLSAIIFYSCTEKNKNEKNTIYVDLNQKQAVSIFDIFSKIDIIPLETNDSSLIKQITKVIVKDNRFYILDETNQILTFSADGKFLFRINHRGEGPTDYISISDFNVFNDSLFLLSNLDNKMHIYDSNGNFGRKFSLPSITGAYDSFLNINKDTLAFWTYDYQNRLKIYSMSANKIVNEKMPEQDNIFRHLSIDKFPYKKYIASVNDNRVFEITPRAEIVEAYKWDFGNLNNTKEMIENPIKVNSQNDEMKCINKITSSEVINYIFLRNNGNSRYIYTKLCRNEIKFNILYNKSTAKTYLFEKTTEKLQIYSLYWTEDYMIGFIPGKAASINDIVPNAVLDAKNIKIKNKLTEFDNPILIKYTFKK